MPANRYDQASRYMGQQAGAKLWPWLLGLTPKQVGFIRSLQTHFTLPGFPERIGDLAAALTDLEGGGPPWAVCAEFQAAPDFDMPDRLLVVLGLIRLTERPGDNPGDRFNVGAVVINLTGQGLALRDHEWRGAGLHVLIEPREWNFKDVSANLVLRQIEHGEAPQEALVWIPCMRGGNTPGIIKRWLVLANREANRQRRTDLGLAQVFAELVGSQDVWREALKGLNMQESPFMKQWENKVRAEDLLQILAKRFKAVPDDLRTAIVAVNETERLVGWIDLAITSRTLRSFRREAGV
jgi:hypothetical protein